MNTLKQKIKNTLLFSAEEKIDVLIDLDTYEPDVCQQIEAIIDKYDTQVGIIRNDLKTNINNRLTNLELSLPTDQQQELHTAFDQLRQGFSVVV
jgi:hypothetical protein